MIILGLVGEKYWEKYSDGLIGTRILASNTTGGPYHQFSGKILVPTTAHALPGGKYVVKISLSLMATAGSRPAFPDPLLVAYKSSINWTRIYSFQMMAEAEPHDAPARRQQPDVVELGAFSVNSEITV